MSRRYFFGLGAGAAAAIAIGPLVQSGGSALAMPVAAGNEIAITDVIALQCLEIMRNNLVMAKLVNRVYESGFRSSGIVGDRITVRVPHRYSA